MSQLKSLSGTFRFAPQSGDGPDLRMQFAALCDALSRNYRLPAVGYDAGGAPQKHSPEHVTARFPVVLTYTERAGENLIGTAEKKLREWFAIALEAAKAVPGTIGGAAKFIKIAFDVLAADGSAKAAAAEVKRAGEMQPTIVEGEHADQIRANLSTNRPEGLPVLGTEHWKVLWDFLRKFDAAPHSATAGTATSAAPQPQPQPKPKPFDVTQLFGWMNTTADSDGNYAFTLEGRTRNAEDAVEYGTWARMDILGPDGAQLLTHYADKAELQTWLWTGQAVSAVISQSADLRVALLGASAIEEAKGLTSVRGRLWFSDGSPCDVRTLAVYIPPEVSHVVDCCQLPFELDACGDGTREFLVAPIALAVTQTDPNGYFEFDYPAETKIAARYALFHVAGLRAPISFKLDRCEQGAAFPARTLIEIDSRLIKSESKPVAWLDGEDTDCACNGGIEFEQPDRAVDEFKFDIVVRTTDPMIDDGALQGDGAEGGEGSLAEDEVDRYFRKSLSRTDQIAWDEPRRIARAVTISHGRILSIAQSWHTDGYSLGDLRYSLPLAPLQKKNIAIIDWDRQDLMRMEAQQENRESLNNLVGRQRDISEIANSAFNETIKSHSDSSSSSGSAGGGFGLLGGFFGGVSGGSANSSSNASQSSNRTLASSFLNQLRDQTVQAASSFRAQRITTVQQVNQSESARAVTETIANRNACHAITVQYFEVLRHFKVEHELVGVRECLFIPLPLSRFDDAKVLRWRAALDRYLPDADLRLGLGSVERRAAARSNPSVYGAGATYGDQTLRSLSGTLRLRLNFPMPSAAADPKWDPNTFEISYASKAPVMALLNRFVQQTPEARPEFWESQVAPSLAREFVRKIALSVKSSAAELPLEAELASAFANGGEHRVSLSQTRDFADLPPIARGAMRAIEIRSPKITGTYSVELTAAEFYVATDDLSVATQPRGGARGALGTGAALCVETPLSIREEQDRRKEDDLLADRLLAHINDNLEYYHKAIWWTMDADRRYGLLDGYVAPNSGGRSVASVVENRLVGIVGNSLVMPVAPGIRLDYFIDSNKCDTKVSDDNPLLAYYRPAIPLEPTRVCVPTKGVFAEAVMGKCNACEKIDNSRNWQYWQHALPDQPTEIQPVSLDSHGRNVPLATPPGTAPAVITQVATSLPAAPEPGVALANVLAAITKSGVFPDMTGLAGTQQNTREALQNSFDTTLRFGELGAQLSQKQLDAAMDAMKLIATLYTGIPLPMSGGGNDATDSPAAVKQSIQSDAKAGRITTEQAQGALDRLNHVMIDRTQNSSNQQLLDHPEVSSAIQTAAQRGARLSISHQGSNIDVGESAATSSASERPRRSLWNRIFGGEEANAAEPPSKISGDAQRIIDACRREFDANQYDCNHFVKAVTKHFFTQAPFGDNLQADGIINVMQQDHRWLSLDDDPAKAIAAAKAGKMVIAGMTHLEYGAHHGHLAIVIGVEGETVGKALIPTCYAGSNNTKDPGVRVHPGRISRTFSPTFARQHKIHYFAREIER